MCRRLRRRRLCTECSWFRKLKRMRGCAECSWFRRLKKRKDCAELVQRNKKEMLYRVQLIKKEKETE